MTATMAYCLRCIECGKSWEPDASRYVCPACAAAQEPGGLTRGVLAVELESLPPRLPDGLAATCRFLPLADASLLPPLAIGWTPLLEVPALRTALGMPHLYVKDDTRNPSASTKDRAAALVVAKAREYGLSTIAAASTGNAATALAAACAASGMKAIVFVPASAPEAKLVQILSYGAQLVPVDGPYDAAFELCLAACQRYGWYNRNTAYNPYTIEGKKTASLEIAAQLAPSWPDAVVVPVGDGVILSGVAKGFRDLVRAGLGPRLPRLIAAQAAGSPAIYDAVRDPARVIRLHSKAASVADSLTVSMPRNGIGCLMDLAESGGDAVLVPEDEVVAAIGALARGSGVFAEPAAATAYAGLLVARRQGLIDAGERVVVLITGSGLKDVRAAARGVVRPPAVAPLIEAVDAIFGPPAGRGA
ncbi:MAG: threonine synthase [Candidatus Schekmanbacteria bacterium]|nr:threonine synthase [Candidatus Schekmanbacteria bacterium]